MFFLNGTDNYGIIHRCTLTVFVILVCSSQAKALLLSSKGPSSSFFDSNRSHLSYITCTSPTPKEKAVNYGFFGDSKFLSRKELLQEKDVFRGKLKNGLRYSFYKKDSPNVEAFMQVCSGSADEKDDQRGMAHLCEHVTYMGSNKRSRLCQFGVKTNAFTDYNQTVFFVKTDSNLGCETRKNTLQRILEVLVDVIKAPTQFNEYELEKERKAVFSEAKIITTAEYYKNCNTVKAIHEENILPKRFPIGDLDMMKNYTVDELKKFHTQHYIPDNIHLFIQGNFMLEEVEEAIKEVFEGLKNPDNLREIQLLYKNTEKQRRKGLPPVWHNYNQREPVFNVWSCDNLPLFSFEVLKKMPIPALRTFQDYFDFILNKLVYKILNIHFSIFKRDLQLYNSVTANDFDCINEGCRIRSLEIKCEEDNWKNSVYYVLSEIRHMMMEKISKTLLDYAKDSLLFDFETTNEEDKSSINFIENEICNRANLDTEEHVKLVKRSYEKINQGQIKDKFNKLFNWQKKELKGIKVLASSPTTDVTLDEVKEVFYESINSRIKYRNLQVELSKNLLDKKDIERIESRSSLEIREPLNKNFHKESFDAEEYIKELSKSDRRMFREYYEKFREYMELVKEVETYEPPTRKTEEEYESMLLKEFNCDPRSKEDTRCMYSLMNTNKTILRTKPCKLYKSTIGDKDEPVQEYENQEKEVNRCGTEESEGFEFYKLKNNVRVNFKKTDDNSLHISTNIPVVEYMNSTEGAEVDETKKKKLMLLLVATSLMESGSMGKLDRKQVELFCEVNSINVNITLNHDYLNIAIDIPFHTNSKGDKRMELTEFAMQILNNILENHRINIDELERARQKLVNDHQQYIKDIKNYAIGELVNSMSGGKVGFHGLEIDKLEEVEYEKVLEEANRLFNGTLKEVTIVTNVNEENVKNLALKYLSSSSIVSQKGDNSESEELSNSRFLEDDFHNMGESCVYNRNEEGLGSMQFLGKDESEGEVGREKGGVENYYRKNLVESFNDVTDKAVVVIGGHAPNSSGFLPDGRHMSTMMEKTLKETSDDGENIEKVCVLKRELWMHPAFPRASGDLFSEILNSDLFTNLRTMKNLTYDTRVDMVTNDLNQSYFVITTFSNSRNYSVVLSEIQKYLKRVSSLEKEFSKQYLENCKRMIKSRIKNQGPMYYVKNMPGIQLPEATTKNVLSIAEYEKVMDQITNEDMSILMASQVYGIDSQNMYTRVLYSNAV